MPIKSFSDPDMPDSMDGMYRGLNISCTAPSCVTGVSLAAAEGETSDTETSQDSLSGTYTWAIENFSKVKQTKLYSPVFKISQYNW